MGVRSLARRARRIFLDPGEGMARGDRGGFVLAGSIVARVYRDLGFHRPNTEEVLAARSSAFMKNPTAEELADYFARAKADPARLLRVEAEVAPLLTQAVFDAGVSQRIFDLFPILCMQYGLPGAIQSIWNAGAEFGFDFMDQRKAVDELERMFAGKEER